MKGNITRRGERSWRRKFDLGRALGSGKRLIPSCHGARDQAGS